MTWMKGLLPQNRPGFLAQVGLIVVLLLGPLTALAGGPDAGSGEAKQEGVYNLQEYVVTESKFPQKQEYVTQQIDIIGEQQINRTPLMRDNIS